MTGAQAASIILTSAALVGAAAEGFLEAHYARLDAAKWEKTAREQSVAIREAAVAMATYETLVRRIGRAAVASADDAAVCASMLPAEQRRSFTGQAK